MEGMRCVVGLDIGSTTTKAVVMDLERQVLGQAVLTSGGYFEERAEKAIREALEKAARSLADVAWITATGYGRLRAPRADQTVTELSCHARGAFYHVPRKITVVDIGGQDNKIISIDEHGRRGRTKMNRKCAAGTGAFIENAARQLDLDSQQMQSMASCAAGVVEIGSFCTVFAATEIIEHLRRGSAKDSIARGVLRAVALRAFEMERFCGEVVLTGGVAEHFPLVAEELAQLSGCPVTIPPHPQTAGALGAALYALDALEKKERGEEVKNDEDEHPGLPALPGSLRGKEICGG